jgi:hypothetical protein
MQYSNKFGYFKREQVNIKSLNEGTIKWALAILTYLLDQNDIRANFNVTSILDRSFQVLDE